MLVTEIIGNLGADATIKNFSGQNYIAFNDSGGSCRSSEIRTSQGKASNTSF